MVGNFDYGALENVSDDIHFETFDEEPKEEAVAVQDATVEEGAQATIDVILVDESIVKMEFVDEQIFSIT